MTLRVVTIPGSLRGASYNRKLLKLAELPLEQQVELDRIDLRDFPLPPFDQEIQDAGMPAPAVALKERIRAAHGVLISAPEYNWSVSGMWKNVFDWTTRGKDQPWTGKVVGLMGASNGPWGTWRATPHYRQMYQPVGAIVLPQSFNLPNAAKVWDEHSQLLDDQLPARIGKFVEQFLELLRQMHASR